MARKKKQGLGKVVANLQMQLQKLTSGMKSLVEFGGDDFKDVKMPSTPNRGESIEVHFNMINVAKAVVVVLLLLLAAAFINEISEILLITFISYLFAAALMPTVDWLHARKIPRALSVVLIYVVSITFLIVFISSFVPTLGSEILQLARNLQDLLLSLGSGDLVLPQALNFLTEPIQSVLANADLEVISSNLETYLTDLGLDFKDLAGNAINFLVAFSNGFLNLALVLVLTFLFVVDKDAVNAFVVTLFPKKYEKYILAKNAAIQRKIGAWLQGMMLLMVIMTALTYVALLILGVEYALTLAAFTGLAELLPAIGPLLALLIALPIAANQAWWLVVAVMILYFVLQQLEGNVLVPMVMNKAVGMNPIFVILAMLIGFQFLGILGIIIAVPVAATVGIFLGDLLNKEY